jgi:hypothetical protein
MANNKQSLQEILLTLLVLHFDITYFQCRYFY